MNEKGHRVGAFVAGGIFLYCFKNSQGLDVITGLVCIGVGAFIPDLDAEHSYIRSKLPKLAKWYSGIADKYKGSKVGYMTFRHRGALLHSVWSVLLCLLVYMYTDRLMFYGLAVGIFSHHLLDMLTPAGLNYLYPAVNKRIGLYHCKKVVKR
jgi:membrane-bound metal-dependent hydrolase YbcI (DUF457 family)